MSEFDLNAEQNKIYEHVKQNPLFHKGMLVKIYTLAGKQRYGLVKGSFWHEFYKSHAYDIETRQGKQNVYLEHYLERHINKKLTKV